ncbi:MAG: diphosphate--fructose-6-phosphate 1-phosphotransferase, partial [Oscillospiraceae bacterium]|nr:diphosphate--fructose-6-phosphate 1-phosphotransferase [Oscillospiraceae bacterium]
MSELIGACLIGQSGGPTAVINSSAYGVIKAALGKKCITKVLAAQHGIRGVLDDNIIDMGKEDAETLELMLTTPASLIRSCRYKLKDFREDDTDYKRILEIFKKYNIRYFFYNGGNDSMDTCNKISEYMATQDYECRIIGVPKTIDNDLNLTDHCPGFGSSAKYIALSVAEVIKDVHVYDRDAIVVIEVMGRHAGWLAGAAALSKICCEGPAFVYLPEVVFDMDQFFKDLDEFHKHHKRIVIVFSEGIRDKHGKFISEYGINDTNVIDEFGHSQLGGLAATMSNIIRAKTGSKVRGIELSLLQRCAGHAASKTDRDEAAMAGSFAVEAAVAG